MNISDFRNHCCGCAACCVVCPTKAITMEKNAQGFFYPVVDETKCINCGKCVRHCSFNNVNENNEVRDAYALKHTDAAVRAASRSGGLFTALSDLVFDLNGVVYGCELRNCREAVHIRATSKKERDCCRGSKYIQSSIYDVYEMVKADLERGLWVLFTGTSCQVDAIAEFCRKTDCSKLLLVDIVCYGVPSQKVWGDYLTFISKKQKKNISSVEFRDKNRFGWAAHRETFTFEDGTNYSGDYFAKLFGRKYILREDCFDCPYKSLRRVGDISIGDCWGIEKQSAEFSDDKGISLVLCNTEKGAYFVSSLENVDIMMVELTNVMQPCLRGNWPKPTDYDAFWEYYENHSFRNVVDRYVLDKDYVLKRIGKKLKHGLGKINRAIFR